MLLIMSIGLIKCILGVVGFSYFIYGLSGFGYYLRYILE